MAYGLLYGMGKHALARSMGVPPDTAQQLSDSFRASIPDLVSSRGILLSSLRESHRWQKTSSSPLDGCWLSAGHIAECPGVGLGHLSLHTSSSNVRDMRRPQRALVACAQDKWMRGLVEACRRDRFVTTIGGRRRYLMGIDSASSGKRAAAERQAINSAVQVPLRDTEALAPSDLLSVTSGVRSLHGDSLRSRASLIKGAVNLETCSQCHTVARMGMPMKADKGRHIGAYSSPLLIRQQITAVAAQLLLSCRLHTQGSAADVCKAAMVALHTRAAAIFADRPTACRLILQVRGPSADARFISA